jgi:hypothetical protein
MGMKTYLQGAEHPRVPLKKSINLLAGTVMLSGARLFLVRGVEAPLPA